MQQYILGGVFLSILISITIYLQYLYWKSRETNNWPITGGIIRRCKISTLSRNNEPRHWYIQLLYSYTVANIEYSGKRAFFGGNLVGLTSSEIFRLESLYKEGKPINVYYNSQKPQEAVIIPGIQKNLVFVLRIFYVATFVCTILLFL